MRIRLQILKDKYKAHFKNRKREFKQKFRNITKIGSSVNILLTVRKTI